MTPLRRRMLEDMQIRNFSENARETYLPQVSLFRMHFADALILLHRDQSRQISLALRRMSSHTFSIISSNFSQSTNDVMRTVIPSACINFSNVQTFLLSSSC